MEFRSPAATPVLLREVVEREQEDAGGLPLLD